MISSSRTTFLPFGLKGWTKGKNGGFDSRGEEGGISRRRGNVNAFSPPTSTNEDNSNKCKRGGENG